MPPRAFAARTSPTSDAESPASASAASAAIVVSSSGDRSRRDMGVMPMPITLTECFMVASRPKAAPGEHGCMVPEPGCATTRFASVLRTRRMRLIWTVIWGRRASDALGTRQNRWVRSRC